MKNLLEKPDTLWRLLILLLIAVAAGPDVFAALELRILLEILGVALFTTAFVAGGMLALSSFKEFVREVLTPTVPMAVFRHSRSPVDKALATSWMLVHAAPWIVMAIAGVIWARETLALIS